MIIGIPKEIKDQEYRVSLSPTGTATLHQKGHCILLESGAGEGSGLSDAEYEKAGAEILSSKQNLFDRSELIVKIKEPLPVEYALFHRGQILFTFLHLAANRELLQALLKHGVSAIAYEIIELENGAHPLLKPMSEVAGRMSVLIGAHYLQKRQGGMGLLLSGVAGVAKGRVTVIGGGIVGKNAAQVALALGAEVSVIESDSSRRSTLDDFFKGDVVTLPPYTALIADQLEQSDLVIGAAAKTGEAAPHLVSRAMISKMKKGAVVVDVAIDQGGCFKTSRPTSHSNPVYEVEGVLHYCVANMPGVVPKTSTFALANETFPYIERLADLGFKNALAADPALERGLNIHEGKIAHPGLAEVFNGQFELN